MKVLFKSCLSVLLIGFGAICVISVAIVFYAMQLTPEADQDYCIRTKSYLENKYDREVIIDEYMYDYHGRPGVRAHFADQSELQFVSHEDYDYYLSTCLEHEAENIIMETIDGEVQVLRVVCYMSTSCKDENLFEYYKQNGCSISWADDELYGTLDSVRVYYVPNDEFCVDDVERIAVSIVEFFCEKKAMDSCWVSLIANSESYSPYNYYFSVKDNRISANTN